MKTKKAKASLTIEAMISIIILISLMITVYSISNVSNVYTKMQLSLNNSASYIASLAAYNIPDRSNASKCVVQFIIDSHRADADYDYNKEFVKPITDDEKADLNYFMSNYDALIYYTILLENACVPEDEQELLMDRVVKGWLISNYSNCEDVDAVLKEMNTTIDDIDTSGSSLTGNEIILNVKLKHKILSPISIVPGIKLDIKSVATKW